MKSTVHLSSNDVIHTYVCTSKALGNNFEAFLTFNIHIATLNVRRINCRIPLDLSLFVVIINN